MTYGHGQEPGNGWPPPSDPEPTLYGRRRASEEDEPDRSHHPRRSADPEPERSWPPLTDRYGPRPPGREGHTGSARVPPPEPRRPERPQGLHPMAPPTDNGSWGPARPHATGSFPAPNSTSGFPAAPPHQTNSFPSSGGMAPVAPMERPGWPGRDTAGVPPHWGEPDLDLPDRRRRPGESSFDHPARHGDGPPRRPKSPLWLTALGLVAVAVLVAVFAAGGYFMFANRGPGPADSGPKLHDISNRTADPAPLTEAEVFPAA